MYIYIYIYGKCWQALIDLNEHDDDDGCPSASFADGNFLDSGYSLSKCKDSRWKTLNSYWQKTYFSFIKSQQHCKSSN